MEEGKLLDSVYDEVCNQVCKIYGASVVPEHEYIREFFEGPIPSFKLILVHKEDGPGFIMASFHIDMEAVVAIQWFMRFRALDPNIRVTACYMRDSTGTSYVGEDAHVLKMYAIEQEIVSQFVGGDRDAEEVVRSNPATPTRLKPSPTKVYSDYKHAMQAFVLLIKKDGDLEH